MIDSFVPTTCIYCEQQTRLGSVLIVFCGAVKPGKNLPEALVVMIFSFEPHDALPLRSKQFRNTKRIEFELNVRIGMDSQLLIQTGLKLIRFQQARLLSRIHES
jgi:hypothetical protein